MPAEMELAGPIAELGLLKGDLIRIKVASGPMCDRCWYIIAIGSREELVQARAMGGVMMFRFPDAPPDDLRAFVEGSHRVLYHAFQRTTAM